MHVCVQSASKPQVNRSDMANPKYIKKVVPISPAQWENFDRVRGVITKELGFQPSMSETIAYVLHYYESHHSGSAAAAGQQPDNSD